MKHSPEELKEFASELADLSGEIALKYFRTQAHYDDKEDHSPCSIADKEIEKTLRSVIKKRYPNHGVIGEEYGSENTDSEFVWALDPIDGTKAFITGKPIFGTIIGCAKDKKPCLGIIDQPFTKERWVGATDEATSYNGTDVNVSHCSNLSDAMCYTDSPHSFDKDEIARLASMQMHVKHLFYEINCYAYGLLSMGEIDIIFETECGVDDIIGLVPIIEGAGGYIRDWNGKEITLSTKGNIIAASSEALAQSMLSTTLY